MTTRFYIYAWCDPNIKGPYDFCGFNFQFLPFYIGKGCNQRHKVEVNRNSHFENKVRKIRNGGKAPVVIRVSKGLTEQRAFELEMTLIREIGRRDVGTGPLVNWTNGGEGSSGWVPSTETRKKISESLYGKMTGRFAGEKHPMYGRKHKEITKKKISEAIKGELNPFFGRHHSDATKAILSRKNKVAQAGKKNPMYGKKHSSQARAKITRALTGRVHSDARKAQISQFFRGRIHTKEHIAKRTASYKATVEKRRVIQKAKYKKLWDAIEMQMQKCGVSLSLLSNSTGILLSSLSAMRHGRIGIGPISLEKIDIALCFSAQDRVQ